MAETVVAGMVVGDAMADFCDASESALNISTNLIEDCLRRQRRHLTTLANGKGGENAFELTRLMQDTMTNRVGIFRNSEGLQEAVTTLQSLQRRSRNITLRSNAAGANPELVAAYRLQRMLKLALCVACGALQRTESRGAHYRADYPRRDDSQWMCRTLTTWSDRESELPVLDYEPLDIMRMELPPGWRGYGAEDYIEHPDTARRQLEIESGLACMDGSDRHERQHALMPFRHLLAAHLRGHNQRLGED